MHTIKLNKKIFSLALIAFILTTSTIARATTEIFITTDLRKSATFSFSKGIVVEEKMKSSLHDETICALGLLNKELVKHDKLKDHYALAGDITRDDSCLTYSRDGRAMSRKFSATITQLRKHVLVRIEFTEFVFDPYANKNRFHGSFTGNFKVALKK